MMFTRDEVEKYLTQINDKTAASMLQTLLDDVNMLEQQLRTQQERMHRYHENVWMYTEELLGNSVSSCEESLMVLGLKLREMTS